MTLVMYERLGHDGRRPSPFSWRIRYALAHKGVPVEFRLVRFADVETIRGLSGQHMVPILLDGYRVVDDLWNIACYLEDRFPELPSIFGGEAGRGLARLLNHWSDTVLGTGGAAADRGRIHRLPGAGGPRVLPPLAEAAFGCTLEEYCADRPRWRDAFC